MADPRKLPLAAAVNDGRLVVSIGLDTLDAMRKRLRGGADRVSAADIADFLVSKTDLDEFGVTPFEVAISKAEFIAKQWNDRNEATTEPSTEFMR